MKSISRYQWAVLIGFLSIAIVLHYYVDAFTLFTWFKHEANALRIGVQTQYVYAVCIYLLSMIISTSVFIPITVLLTVAGGYLFGWFYGTLYAVAGATLGSIVLFLLVRYGIGNYVQQRYALQLAWLNAELDQHGASYLLVLQLLPVTPTWLINIGAGLTPISLWTFMWTTSLGILPGSVMYAYAGQRLYEIESVRDIMTWDIALLFIALALLAAIPLMWRFFYISKS